VAVKLARVDRQDWFDSLYSAPIELLLAASISSSSIGTLQPKSPMTPVATNLAISHRRSQRAAWRRHVDDQEPADPGLQALNNLELVRVRRALLMLEPRDRAVISLRFDAGLGFAEIGASTPFALQRLDLQHNTVITWVQLSGPGTVVGFDGVGEPIVQVGGPGGDVIVAAGQGVQRPVARNFYFGKGTMGIAHLPALGDAHGIWLFAQDGIYLSINGVPSKQSDTPAFLAGPCS
jgi:hypothetical protein